MLRPIKNIKFLGISLFAVTASAFLGVYLVYGDGQKPNSSEQLRPAKPVLPMFIPNKEKRGKIWLKTSQGEKPTTLIPELQFTMDKYIKTHGNHISAAVIVEIATGKIIAMAQGRSPKKWDASTHTALYSSFPAASIFKNVSTAAALEMGLLDEDQQIGLVGGCSNVNAKGVWFKDTRPRKHFQMSLKRAYGFSCNGFYAKLALRYLGLGPVIGMSKRFGWDREIPSDFHLAPSPIKVPNAVVSSIHTVGRFAAGFGLVGLSAVHGAWFNAAIGNNGLARPLQLFEKEEEAGASEEAKLERLFSIDTSERLRNIMRRTVRNGTATSAFRKRKYRRIRRVTGGKTGTLTGYAPKGLTTWFTGIYPIKDPEIAVATVSVTGNFWIVKASHLAAESVYQYKRYLQRKAKREHKQAAKMKKSKPS